MSAELPFLPLAGTNPSIFLRQGSSSLAAFLTVDALAVPSNAADLDIRALNAGDKTSSAYNEPLKTIPEETESGAQKVVSIYDSRTCSRHALDEYRSWNSERSEGRIAA